MSFELSKIISRKTQIVTVLACFIYSLQIQMKLHLKNVHDGLMTSETKVCILK